VYKAQLSWGGWKERKTRNICWINMDEKKLLSDKIKPKTKG
jgi:hypothetical protein